MLCTCVGARHALVLGVSRVPNVRAVACELRIASPEPGRTELFESARRAAASVRCLCCRRQALLEPRRIRGSCLGRQRELAPHARRALRQGSRAERQG